MIFYKQTAGLLRFSETSAQIKSFLLPTRPSIEVEQLKQLVRLHTHDYQQSVYSEVNV